MFLFIGSWCNLKTHESGPNVSKLLSRVFISHFSFFSWIECNLVGKNHKMTTCYLRCKPKRRHFARPIFCFCLWWGCCQTWNKEWTNIYFLKSTSRNTGAYWLKEYKNWPFSNVIFTLFVFQSIYGWRSRCLREHHNLHHKSKRQPEDRQKIQF